MSEKKKKNLTMGILIILFILTVSICITVMIKQNDVGSKDLETLAWEYAQKIVCERVRNTMSIEFSAKEKANIEKVGDYRYRVSSYCYVDNVLGNRCKKNYMVILTISNLGYEHEVCFW